MMHQPTATIAHFLSGFSSPPNAAMDPCFDHGLHDATTPWPRQVPLSLYNYTGGAAPPASLSSLAMAMQQQPFELIRSSRYLGPVNELLGEFCSLQGDLETLPAMAGGGRRAPKVAGKWDGYVVEGSSASSTRWGNLALSSMDLLELERRKARLLSMVEEVDRRYRQYRERIRAVELSFEAVAGAGIAQMYTNQASWAMSRHFGRLKNALVGQIRVLTTRAEGERGVAAGMAVAVGATKGDTPRLRVLERCMRQRKSFQQSGAFAGYPWRPQRGLPGDAVAILRSWFFEHFLHPYPNDVDKRILARQSGLSRRQITNWFINARVRLWKPMIEKMYNEETNPQSSNHHPNQNPSSGSGGKHDYMNKAQLTIAMVQSHLLRTRNPNAGLIPSIVADGDQLHSYQVLHGGNGEMSLTPGLPQRQLFLSSMTMMQQHSVLMSQAEEEDAVLPYRNLMGAAA